MNRDLFLSILALDAYNRGYDLGIDLGSQSDAPGRNVGGATVLVAKGEPRRRRRSWTADGTALPG